MGKDLTGRTLGIIHVAAFTAQTVEKFIHEIIPEVNVMHLADDTLQRDNLKAGVGVIPKNNYYKFATYAHFLEEAGADLIMLACSTFNSAVEVARPMVNIPLLQIDRPMMDLAVRQGNRVGLLATLPTTVPSSERLLKQAASDAGKRIEIKTVLCSEAFSALKSGDIQKHNEMLLEEIEQLSGEVDSIVMAQVSMSVLEEYLANTAVPVYNSGRTGFMKAREIMEGI